MAVDCGGGGVWLGLALSDVWGVNTPVSPRPYNQRLLLRLLVVAVLMFGFSYALIPFYREICKVVGLNEVIRTDDSAPKNLQVDLSRQIEVQFAVSNQADSVWRLRPVQNSLRVHPGQLVTAYFELENTGRRTLSGQASPSYAPALAAQHLKKLECFCFRPQLLAAGEKKLLPVVLVVDAGLPQSIPVITLSYNFFTVEGR